MAILQIVLEEKIPTASFAMGDPIKYVDKYCNNLLTGLDFII
jgi:hypothetical protein